MPARHTCGSAARCSVSARVKVLSSTRQRVPTGDRGRTGRQQSWAARCARWVSTWACSRTRTLRGRRTSSSTTTSRSPHARAPRPASGGGPLRASAPRAVQHGRQRAPVRSAVAELTRITTLHPRTYNEARTIGENFREGVPVIMNLSEMDDADAKRLVDFAAGLVFARARHDRARHQQGVPALAAERLGRRGGQAADRREAASSTRADGSCLGLTGRRRHWRRRQSRSALARLSRLCSRIALATSPVVLTSSLLHLPLLDADPRWSSTGCRCSPAPGPRGGPCCSCSRSSTASPTRRSGSSGASCPRSGSARSRSTPAS